MYYELYIDVFFLVNFMMDYILLSLVRKMLKCPATHGSICTGAIAGALSSCLIIVIPVGNPFVRFLLFHGASTILMIKTGLRIGWNKTFLRAYILLYISAFLVGGVMSALKQYLKVGSLFFALAIAGYEVSLGVWNLLSYMAEHQARRCKVRLYIGEQTCEIQALIDTGNRLRDAVTGKPVSVVSAEVRKRLDIGGTSTEEEQTARKGLRYISYHSVGKAEGTMPLITLDKMCVCRGTDQWLKKPLVAVSEEGLTADDYEMLINPDLLGQV